MFKDDELTFSRKSLEGKAAGDSCLIFETNFHKARSKNTNDDDLMADIIKQTLIADPQPSDGKIKPAELERLLLKQIVEQRSRPSLEELYLMVHFMATKTYLQSQQKKTLLTLQK